MLRTSFAAALAAFFLISPARAMVCMEHKTLTDILRENHKETRREIGVVGDTTIAELYVSDEGSWTIIITDTMARSCIVLGGQGWGAAKDLAQEPEY